VLADVTTEIPIQFAPDAEIGRRLDERMRDELAASLRHIAEAVGGDIPLPQGFDAAVAAITAGRPIDPLLFAAYYRATEALLGDDVPTGLRHLALLAERVRPLSGMETADLAQPLLDGTRFDYYSLALNTDPTMQFGIKPAGSETIASGRANILEGLALLRNAAPEIAGEFDAIVHQLVLLESTDPDAKYNFDGGSSYQLWGALALNVEKPKPVVSMAETLAHESAHSFLFGHTIHEPLVHNPDEELFKSPLRIDPRPMDGIYHATFVTARMHYAMDRLIAWGRLPDADLAFAEAERSTDAAKFRDGLAVVEAHGDLSPTGIRLMTAAKAYMEKSKSVSL